MADQNGYGQIFRAGSPFRTVMVLDVDEQRGDCMVMDVRSKEETSMEINTPEGFAPQLGDVWISSNDTGRWRFHRMIDPASVHEFHPTVRDVMEHLSERHITSWRPFESTNAVVETAQGAFIGERRMFKTVPNASWVRLNGSLPLISRYPLLAELYGTTYGGDGITTFGLPAVYANGHFGSSSTYYFPTALSMSANYTMTTTPTSIMSLSYPDSLLDVPANGLWSYYAVVSVQLGMNFTSGAGFDVSYANVFLNGNEYSLAGGAVTGRLVYSPNSAIGPIMLSGTYVVPLTFDPHIGRPSSWVFATYAWKGSNSGTNTVAQDNSQMVVDLRCAGADGAQWYVCAE